MASERKKNKEGKGLKEGRNAYTVAPSIPVAVAVDTDTFNHPDVELANDT